MYAKIVPTTIVLSMLGTFLYWIVTPKFFFEDRTAAIHCPVKEPQTISIQQDGSEAKVLLRHVKVECGYAEIDAPKPSRQARYGVAFADRAYANGWEDTEYDDANNRPRKFNDDATETPSITVGDAFLCVDEQSQRVRHHFSSPVREGLQF